jgi:hypothetical protein
MTTIAKPSAMSSLEWAAYADHHELGGDMKSSRAARAVSMLLSGQAKHDKWPEIGGWAKQIFKVFKYKRRNFSFHLSDETFLSGTFWDGGCRSTYYLVVVNDKNFRVGHVYPRMNPPQFGGPTVTPYVHTSPEACIVNHEQVQSRIWLTIYSHPETIYKILGGRYEP